MSATQHPSIVVVPGGHHVPRHYQKIIEPLKQEGYKVVAVTLPLHNDTSVAPGWQGNLYVIRQAVEQEIKLGNDVLLVLHSASGTTGPAAIKGLTQQAGSDRPGVFRMLAISGILTLPGQGLLDYLQGKTAFWLGPKDDRMEVFPADYPGDEPSEVGFCLCSPIKALYNDMTPEQQKEAYDLLVPTHLEAFAGVSDYAAWTEIPMTYIVCGKDRALFPEVQQGMIERTGVAMDVRRLDASHSPFISVPERIVEFVKEAAQR